MRQRIPTLLIILTRCRSGTLLYALIMLAIHPHIQDILFSEIQHVCKSRMPLHKDLQNLTYALCIMYETLRMFPAVVLIPKRAAREETLLGKHYIPEGSIIAYDTVNLHRNTQYWGDDINTFNPSRFDGRKSRAHPLDLGNTRGWVNDGNIKLPTRGAFCAFSEGVRTCIGMFSTDCG